MANHRTLDADFWEDGKLLPLPLRARYLYIGLVTGYADDEGRFVPDTLSLARRIFSPTDELKTEDIEAWLGLLADLGLILFYVRQGKTYGFVVSWYKRQVLPKLYRTPSSLPEPPVKVASWRSVDLLHERLKEREDRARMASTQAVRLFYDLPEEEQLDLCPEFMQSYVKLATTKVDLQGKGREGKGEDVQTAPNDSLPEASDEAPDAPPKLSLQEQLEVLRDGIPPEDLALVDEFCELCGAENKTGVITLGRQVNETRNLLELREKLGRDPWRYGIDQACRHNAPNVNYVKQAASGWGKQARRDSQQPSGPRKYTPPSSPEDFGPELEEELRRTGHRIAGDSNND